MKYWCMLLLMWSLISGGVHWAVADAKRVIAFAQDDMKNDFRKAQVFEVRDALKKNVDIAFVYSDAKGQTSLMIHQIDRFIKQKVDLLIVGANDAEAMAPVVGRAHQAAIPVIILDRGVNTADYTCFINADNFEIGAIGGRYVAEKLEGKGLVLVMEGLATSDVSIDRSRGFVEAVAKYPAIKIIKRTGNYLRKDALLAMDGVVRAGIKVDAIFSASDSMLSGVRMVLKQQNIAPSSIVMVGVDHTSEASEAIRQGSQTATIHFSLAGKEAVEVALKILAGEKVPRHIITPTELVTSANVDDIPPIF